MLGLKYTLRLEKDFTAKVLRRAKVAKKSMHQGLFFALFEGFLSVLCG